MSPRTIRLAARKGNLDTSPLANAVVLELPLDQSLRLSYRPGMGKFLGRYWGYIALALVILGWVTHAVGYVVIAILSLLTPISVLIAVQSL